MNTSPPTPKTSPPNRNHLHHKRPRGVARLLQRQIVIALTFTLTIALIEVEIEV